MPGGSRRGGARLSPPSSGTNEQRLHAAAPGVPPFRIESDGILLRPLRASESQVERMATWPEDEAAASMFNAPQGAWPVEKVRDYVSRFDQRTGFLIGIFQRADGQADTLVGICLIRVNWQHRTGLLEVLIGDRAWRGRHLLRIIGDDLIGFLLNTWHLEKLTAHVRPANKSMKWVLLRGGWKREAYLHSHIATPDGRSDIELYGLLPGDWRRPD